MKKTEYRIPSCTKCFSPECVHLKSFDWGCRNCGNVFKGREQVIADPSMLPDEFQEYIERKKSTVGLPHIQTAPTQVKMGWWKCVSPIKAGGKVWDPGDLVKVVDAGVEELTGSTTITIQWNGDLFTTYYNVFRKYFVWNS